MSKFVRPTPIDKEIPLDPSKVIMSKTDYKGVIQYANDYFVEICGYKEYELMGKPHNIIRHPDMPKVIFKFMWEKLHNGENIYAAVKNLAKDGRYYWVMTYFETTYDEYGNIKAHFARRKAIPEKAKNVFENLYIKILKIEKQNPVVAEKYFYNFIENSEMEYNELFLSILDISEDEFINYFDNKILNTNVNSYEEKDENMFQTKEDTVTNKSETSDVTNENIDFLKNKIEALQKELEKKNTKKSFFKRFFSK